MTDDKLPGGSQSVGAVHPCGLADVLVLSVWCGLAAGELEVATRFTYRSLSSTERLFLMTRHFVWLVPLINMGLFLALAVLLALARRFWPRQVAWLIPRLIVALAIFPVLTVAGRSIYLEAWLLVALGIAFRVAPVLQRHWTRSRRWLVMSVPVLLGLVLLQAGWILGGEQFKQRREDARPLPPDGSPNVLLVVLDTVRADHLGLYGYRRPTSPNLDRLARNAASASTGLEQRPRGLSRPTPVCSPGRWPHELAIKWSWPLRDEVPTLAEYLASLGYATAGFAGNTFYCSYDSGLDRGFTYYRDHVVDALNAARTVRLIDETLKAAGQIGRLLPIRAWTLMKLTQGERKDAGVVNGEFLDWLSRRQEPRRPFFAFLNYVDAHSPYLLPPGASYRFGAASRSDAEFRFLSESWTQANKRRLPTGAVALVRDSYDNCLAYLDKRLGELIDDLERRRLLDQTLVIVTADHGEGMGEHGLFDHGESLYRPEIRVPLLIVLPAARARSPAVVDEFVSLRDLPATVVDLIGVAHGSPFPGKSLAALVVWSAGRSRPRRIRGSPLRAGVTKSIRPEPGSISRQSRPTDFSGRGRLRLHPQ